MNLHVHTVSKLPDKLGLDSCLQFEPPFVNLWDHAPSSPIYVYKHLFRTHHKQQRILLKILPCFVLRASEGAVPRQPSSHHLNHSTSQGGCP